MPSDFLSGAAGFSSGLAQGTQSYLDKANQANQAAYLAAARENLATERGKQAMDLATAKELLSTDVLTLTQKERERVALAMSYDKYDTIPPSLRPFADKLAENRVAEELSRKASIGGSTLGSVLTTPAKAPIVDLTGSTDTAKGVSIGGSLDSVDLSKIPTRPIETLPEGAPKLLPGQSASEYSKSLSAWQKSQMAGAAGAGYAGQYRANVNLLGGLLKPEENKSLSRLKTANGNRKVAIDIINAYKQANGNDSVALSLVQQEVARVPELSGILQSFAGSEKAKLAALYQQATYLDAMEQAAISLGSYANIPPEEVRQKQGLWPTLPEVINAPETVDGKLLALKHTLIDPAYERPLIRLEGVVKSARALGMPAAANAYQAMIDHLKKEKVENDKVNDDMYASAGFSEKLLGPGRQPTPGQTLPGGAKLLRVRPKGGQ